MRMKAQGNHLFVFSEDHDNGLVFDVTDNRASSMTILIDGNSIVALKVTDSSAHSPLYSMLNRPHCRRISRFEFLDIASGWCPRSNGR